MMKSFKILPSAIIFQIIMRYAWIRFHICWNKYSAILNESHEESKFVFLIKIPNLISINTAIFLEKRELMGNVKGWSKFLSLKILLLIRSLSSLFFTKTFPNSLKLTSPSLIIIYSMDLKLLINGLYFCNILLRNELIRQVIFQAQIQHLR